MGQFRRIGWVYGLLAALNGELALLVEKGFACLDGTEADDEETFLNPDSGQSLRELLPSCSARDDKANDRLARLRKTLRADTHCRLAPQLAAAKYL